MAMICLISMPNKNKDGRTVSDISSNYDVVIIDETNVKDPNIKIVDSYKINNIEEMLNIIDEIIAYSKENNVNGWDRNKYGMFVEWMLHNMAYYVGFFTENSRNVDFSVSEEKFYSLTLDED